jgi:hypothetical protein
MGFGAGGRFGRRRCAAGATKLLQLLVEWVRLREKRLFFRENGRDLGWILAPDPPKLPGRAALVVAADVFLPLHGYKLSASEADTVRVLLALVDGTMEGPELALWLRTYMQPLRGE